MTEVPGQQGAPSAAQIVAARNLALKASNLVQEASLLSETLDVSITVPQLLAAVLTCSWQMAERPLTREEFTDVYDYVSGTFASLALPGGPGDVAHARTPEEAAELTDLWSRRVADVAFEVPGMPGGTDD